MVRLISRRRSLVLTEQVGVLGQGPNICSSSEDVGRANLTLLRRTFFLGHRTHQTGGFAADDGGLAPPIDVQLANLFCRSQFKLGRQRQGGRSAGLACPYFRDGVDVGSQRITLPVSPALFLLFVIHRCNSNCHPCSIEITLEHRAESRVTSVQEGNCGSGRCSS